MLECHTGHQRHEHEIQHDNGNKCKRNANKKDNHPRKVRFKKIIKRLRMERKQRSFVGYG